MIDVYDRLLLVDIYNPWITINKVYLNDDRTMSLVTSPVYLVKAFGSGEGGVLHSVKRDLYNSP